MMLLKAIADVKAGQDPIGVVRDPEQNRFQIIVRGEEIPSDYDWKTYWQANVRRLAAVN